MIGGVSLTVRCETAEHIMTEPFHLFIGTPCFGGQVSTIYFASIFKLQIALRSYPNVKMTVRFQDGDALITRARANLVSAFLDDPTATHLMFIDADIGFEPDQIIRLLTSGGEVVAGAYPIKRIDWQKIENAVTAGKPNIQSAALNYVVELENPDTMAVIDGFARARYAGTGFLMIRRSVLEKMCGHYKSLQFRREHSIKDSLASSPNRFALFECMIDLESGIYLSEDFSFCKRWTDIGGQIWVDLQSRLNHVGPAIFYGNLATQFSNLEASVSCASSEEAADHGLHVRSGVRYQG